MKKFFVMFFAGMALLGMTCTSDAAVILSADMDPNAPGIQSNVISNVGDQVTVDFVFELTDSSTLSAWQYSVRFNTSKLAFVSRQETAPAGFGFVETDTQLVDNLGSGLLFRFGHDSGSGPNASFGPFRAGSVTFNVIGTADSPLGYDVAPGHFEPSLDAFLVNGTFAEVPANEITFRSGSVTAVPEPASMTLLAVAAAAGTYYRRRRRNNVANHLQV